MAKNTYGFIQKKHRQPHYYKELFCNYNAVYIAEDGTEFMVEANPHFLVAERLGAYIDHYTILRQDSDCRKVIASYVKTQKRAMEIVEKLLEKHSKTESDEEG